MMVSANLVRVDVRYAQFISSGNASRCAEDDLRYLSALKAEEMLQVGRTTATQAQ